MSIKRDLKLLDHVSRVMRLKHYSIHAERTYSDWIKQYVKFHKLQDKHGLLVDSELKIEEFLT